MSSNIQRLGETLANRMKKTSSAAVPTTVELGTINSNMSLTTDGLMSVIPKGDYMVNLMLSGAYSVSGGAHSHSGESGADGSHSHQLGGLRAGDRVLVIWCGNEPVVAAVVVSS